MYAIRSYYEPFDKDELLQTVAKALDLKTLEHEKQQLDDQLKQNVHFDMLVGNSPAMRHIYKLIQQVSKTKTNVRITSYNVCYTKLLR